MFSNGFWFWLDERSNNFRPFYLASPEKIGIKTIKWIWIVESLKFQVQEVSYAKAVLRIACSNLKKQFYDDFYKLCWVV